MASKQKQGRSGREGGTSNRGFASMDKDKQREIARKGGERSQENDRSGGGGSRGGGGR
jgi:general stress protein YciG